MNGELTFRLIRRDEWSTAMTLAARSFLNEPFTAELFGVETIGRFASSHRFYQASAWHEDQRHLGVFVDGVLVGLCFTSSSGQCHVCLHTDPSQPPDDPTALVDWRFEVEVQAAHADQGVHAWMSRVAVDPALQRAGVGRTLVAESLAHLREERATSVLLECQPHREELYIACGFRRVRQFPDPAGAGTDAVLMRIELDPVT